MEAIAEQVRRGTSRYAIAQAGQHSDPFSHKFCNFYYQTFDADRANLTALYVSRRRLFAAASSNGTWA